MSNAVQNQHQHFKPPVHKQNKKTLSNQCNMVTEEEKRKILRERRAAKMKNTSERLGKITGDRPGFENPEPQPQETAKTQTSPPSTIDTGSSTPVANKRISQTFDGVSPESIESDEAKEFQNVLQQYLKSEHHKHDGLQDQGVADPTMDLFSKLLSGAGGPLDAGAMMNPGTDSGKTPQNLEEAEYYTKLTEFEKAHNDRFKAQFILCKLLTFVSLTLYFYFVEGFHSSLSESVRYHYNLTSDSSFFRWFMSFGVLFTSYYAYKISNLKDEEYTFAFAKILGYLQYVPESFLSNLWRSRIRLFVKYLDLLQLILFDFSVVFVVFGLLSFLQ